MNQWQPEQQITALKYGAYFSLLGCGMFAAILARNIFRSLQWQGESVMAAISVLCALGCIFIAIRWAKKCKGGGGWRALFGSYTEEFASEINRKANSNSFVSLVLMLFPAHILGDPPVVKHLGGSAEIWLNLSNFALFMLVIAGFVWGLTILFNLCEEAEA